MAQILFAKRFLNLKIAYYGPPGAGKATTLAALQARVKGRSDLAEVSLGDDEVAFTTSLVPAWLEPLRGLTVNLQLFSVPGPAFDRPSEHRLALEGADGVVFVADSAPDRLEANQAALERLEANLRAHGDALDASALVFQWNKRDLEDALPLERLSALGAAHAAPGFESVATEERGILEPLQAVARAALERIATALEARDAI